MSSNSPYDCRRWRQLSVFLEDRPGTLGEVCRILGEAGINIWALTLAEGVSHGYLRMIVDTPDRAIEILRNSGYLYFEKEVLLLELANQPGGLAAVARRWGEAGVNIEYCYCASSPRVPVGLVVVKTDDPDRAIAVLQDRPA